MTHLRLSKTQPFADVFQMFSMLMAHCGGESVWKAVVGSSPIAHAENSFEGGN